MNKKSYSVKKLADVAKAISEGNFYKEANLKLKGELKRLAKYIEETRKKLQYIDSPIKSTTKSFPEASMQLSDITRQTEEATHKVISLTEKILDDQNRLTEILKNLKKFVSNNIKKENREIKSIINDIQNINISNKEDLIDLLTALSFQDLTGQKIKKIISLVQDVETKILVLLVSFGLVDKKKREEMVTELKDPSKSIDLKQDLVDDILAEFFE